ncbi:MAG TPA: sigma-70 family RNA polymerase sigma factor [Anaerolineales bacterium]|nr:sigma-70 family RNA polymerase sigma factor [Anaerolineales bacterium]
MSDRTNRFFKLLRRQKGPQPLGSPANFTVFYERTHLPVFRYLYGLTGGPREDVEDLTAESFTRAWRARHTFQGDEAAALGWLLKIARRLVIDDYRRRKARPVTEGDIPNLHVGSDPQPEEAAVQGEDQERIWSLLTTLPDGPREILALRYLLGWRVNRIAEYLEMPENTVSVTINRTLERLRQMWLQEQED